MVAHRKRRKKMRQCQRGYLYLSPSRMHRPPHPCHVLIVAPQMIWISRRRPSTMPAAHPLPMGLHQVNRTSSLSLHLRLSRLQEMLWWFHLETRRPMSSMTSPTRKSCYAKGVFYWPCCTLDHPNSLLNRNRMCQNQKQRKLNGTKMPS